MKSKLTKARHSLKVDFNKFIRLRDTKGQGCGCISCGKPMRYGTKDCQAGHLYPGIAVYRAVEFDEMNVNVQCFKCNYERQGNDVGYRAGFVGKYGEGALKQLAMRAHNQSNLDPGLCMVLKKQYKQKWQALEREYLPKFKL